MKGIFSILLVLFSLVGLANNPLKVKVLDENNQPLTGVKLIEVKTENTVFTDFDGVSELTKVSDTKVYKVEYVGYESGFLRISPNSKEEIKIVLQKK